MSYPPGYPQRDAVEFTVRCPFLTRQQTEALHTQLVLLATGADGDVIVLQLYQQMLEVLSEAHSSYAVGSGASALTSDLSTKQLASASSSPEAAPVLGRRAIYFHHIINATKRRVVKEWALELQLGGFSKIGWPGVVIVEGRELDVQEYVRRLQHLRWKQIVVRGEQTETSSDPSSSSIDAMRRLPRDFQEFPENGMSALSAACRDAGVEELFLTTMKIYGRSDASTQQNDAGRRGQRHPEESSHGRKDSRRST